MYKQNMKRRFLSIVFLALTMTGCAATVPIMSDEFDSAAKQFSPPPGKGNLYITRISTLGFAVLFSVHIDGKLAGSIAPSTYLLFELDPGAHQIIVITSESQDTHNVNVQAGQNYFVDVVPKFGWVAARAELKEISQEEGREAVSKAKRAEPVATGS